MQKPIPVKNAAAKPTDAANQIDAVEDLHFRQDEIERALAALALSSKPETIVSVVQGAVCAMQAQLQNDIVSNGQKLLDAFARDATTDESVAAKLDVVADKLDALVSMLAKPVKRVCTVEMPSGPVTMTVTETR
jgi:uncharacterized protein (AIM24 family)